MDELNCADNAQNAAVNLTRQQAETLLKADLRNLARKVKEGKTLSAGERNMLQCAFSGGSPSTANFAANQSELAEIVGVERKTIARHRKIEGNPGVRPDGRYDVAAWRAWMLERRGIDDDDGLTAQQLRARHILLQNQKLEVQLGILNKTYMPVADVERWGGEMGSAVRKIVTQIHLAAPSLVGCSVPEAEARLKDLEDELLSQFNLLGERMKEWQPSVEDAGTEPEPVTTNEPAA